MKHRTLPAALLSLALLTAGCEEDPFVVQWEESPEETLLYSLDREEMFRASAFDMLLRQEVVVEDGGSQGAWDFAVDRQGGGLVLLPPAALGILSGAGIAAVPGTRFQEVTEAPGDPNAYVEDVAVPLNLDTVYVIRTRQQTGTFGESCLYFGKIQALNIDLAAGILYFVHDTSPVCNDPSLIPRQ